MIKEHNNSTWQGKAYSKIVDTTQQVTSFPVVVRPVENTIPSWTIKGNMSQTGTPTPQNPIQPQETGDMTGNLINVQPFTIEGDSSSHNVLLWSGTLPIGTYTISLNQDDNFTSALRNTIRLIIGGTTYYESATENYHLQSGQHKMTFTISDSSQSVEIRYWGNTLSNDSTFSNIMLNTGSTALPYQPYGYKLDIKSSNTTTPVYMGEVETTRKIKKYEITGLEDWRLSTTYPNTFWINNFESDYDNALFGIISCKCSHYLSVANQSGLQGLNNFDVCLYCYNATATNYHELYLKDNRYSSITDFKTYLQQQYSAGTPVTVWYVLATPQTAVVNEPLRKIGAYSDSVSGTNLSVTAQSPTTIDVDTSLKPSEMDLTYTGTKMCKRKKRVNGAWV